MNLLKLQADQSHSSNVMRFQIERQLKKPIKRNQKSNFAQYKHERVRYFTWPPYFHNVLRLLLLQFSAQRTCGLSHYDEQYNEKSLHYSTITQATVALPIQLTIPHPTQKHAT